MALSSLILRPCHLWPAILVTLAALAHPALAQGGHKAAVVVAQPGGAQPGMARSAVGQPVIEAPGNRQTLALEAGNGRVITLPGPASNVFVADPRVAEVRPASTNSLFVFGVGPGRTTIAAMDQDGHPVSQFDVTVRPNGFVAGEAEAAVARLIGNSRIRVTAQARGVLLTGSVQTPADAARAVSILRGYIPEGQVVENQLAVEASVQINLQVKIVEMNRSVTRALGVNWSAMGTGGSLTSVLGRFTVVGATATGLGALTNPSGTLSGGSSGVNSMIQALAQDNLLRILAEPNLTVMSGQAGSFLAGGEFPVPIGQQNGTITVEFKKYGVTLAVVPTVLSDGRINLHVNPEVSSLTQDGAVTLTAANASIQVPALSVRRAETSVELGSGQTFAIAGLLQDQTTQTTTNVPFLGDLPVLGPLFRSNSFQRQETELVILVTPYVVRPVDDPAKMHTADEHYSNPSDLERILLLRQVGADASASRPSPRIPGAAGFIVQ